MMLLKLMMDGFDILLIDLQDIGARVYTYSTTLFYMLEACAEKSKTVIILDRPNPAGRAVEGTILEPGWESFIGTVPLIMRHGLTPGELAGWYVWKVGLDLDLQVVKMTGYEPDEPPGFGWPQNQLVWVNPSPNAASLNMVRCFPGMALFEGTNLSEGRGTTTPLEMVGAPDLDFREVLKTFSNWSHDWMRGAIFRPCHFEPTFDKYQGILCSGLQIHTDHPVFNPYLFKPYRIAAGLMKVIRKLVPDYHLWRRGVFEYENDRLAIDILSGSAFLRSWVDDPEGIPWDLEKKLMENEAGWLSERSAYLIY